MVLDIKRYIDFLLDSCCCYKNEKQEVIKILYDKIDKEKMRKIIWGSLMGSCTNIGIFMDFFITRYDETNEKSGEIFISYKAKEIGGNYSYSAVQLEALIYQIIRHCYLNNNYYESVVDNLYKDLSKELKGA